MLFDRQYILTERVEVETRYDSDDEPYSWYICYVTLENKNLSHLPVSLLSEEQMSRYSIYMSTLGNRPDLFPDSPYVDNTLPTRRRVMRFRGNIWTMKHSPLFSRRQRNTSAIPMCGAAPARLHPLTAPAMCHG